MLTHLDISIWKRFHVKKRKTSFEMSKEIISIRHRGPPRNFNVYASLKLASPKTVKGRYETTTCEFVALVFIKKNSFFLGAFTKLCEYKKKTYKNELCANMR